MKIKPSLIIAAVGVIFSGCSSPASYDQKPVWTDVPAANSTSSNTAGQSDFVPVAQNEILVPTKINGKPFYLILDTGSEGLVIWNRTAQALGMPTSRAANAFSGTVQSGDLTVWNRTAHVSFSLFAPHHLSQDAGLLPWNIFSKDIMQIDAADGRAWLLKQLPSDVASWTPFRIESVFGSYLIPLNIQVPCAGGGTWDVDIDTGDPRGISLSPADWKTWKAAHPEAPLTYSDVTEQSFFGGPEFAIAEQSWAKQFSLGTLEFSDTQIEADHMFLSSLANTFGKSHLMLGFQALKQYDVIVDGVHGFIYFHSKKVSPVVLPHNRLGAVFVPHGFGTKTSSSEMKKIGPNTYLEARVATNSPAYEAGIRDGDVLLGIEGYNGPTSGSDAMAKLLGYFSAPTGSKMIFNLKRGDKPFAATAILQNILSP